MKRLIERWLLIAAAVATAGACITAPARAQDWPRQPVRVVVPFEAGGTVDALGRAVVAEISRQSKARLFIDNRPGANSLIGTVDVAKSAPDGYTLLNVSPSVVLNPLLKTKLAYAMDDLTPVTALGVGKGYLLVARKDLPVKTFAQLRELAGSASRSGKPLTYGTPGIGNAIHLATETLAKRLGVSLLHVPYKGSASALTAIVAGQVDVMLLSPATVIPLAREHQLQVLAFTGDQRSSEFPDVPTLKESGLKDFSIKGTWVGWFVPAGTPAKAVDWLQQQVSRALKSPRVAAALSDGGFAPDGRSPAAFAQFVQSESRRYAEIIKATGLEVQ